MTFISILIVIFFVAGFFTFLNASQTPKAQVKTIFAPPITHAGTFIVDQPFSIRGVGTVFTGRVEKGLINKGDLVYTKKENSDEYYQGTVKKIESFKETRESAHEGEQVGIVVEGFESWMTKPGSLIIK